MLARLPLALVPAVLILASACVFGCGAPSSADDEPGAASAVAPAPTVISPGIYDAAQRALVVMEGKPAWANLGRGECFGTISVDPSTNETRLKQDDRCDLKLELSGTSLRAVGDAVDYRGNDAKYAWDQTYTKRPSGALVGVYKVDPKDRVGIEIFSSTDQAVEFSIQSGERPLIHVTAPYQSGTVFKHTTADGCTVYIDARLAKNGHFDLVLYYSGSLRACPDLVPFGTFVRE
jgi:hypothetical protein